MVVPFLVFFPFLNRMQSIGKGAFLSLLLLAVRILLGSGSLSKDSLQPASHMRWQVLHSYVIPVLINLRVFL